MDDKSRIFQFAVKWCNKFKDQSISCRELEAHYLADDCATLGFEMDCGQAFWQWYGGAVHDAEELHKVIDEITDIPLLGSAIYSRWRYFSHWASDGDDISNPKNRLWFILALKRLARLTSGNMSIEIKKVYEHDMDLLIIEEFVSDRKFARIFLDKLHLSDDYTIHKVSHSLADADGESDITLILQYPDKKVALLIEDKIDAQTMPEQSERYHKRAQSAISRGEYDNHYVMLAAPADYHREHENDSNADYKYRVHYEEMREHFAKTGSMRAAFKVAMIDCALREKKAGYIVQEDQAVTEFWIKLRRFCKANYPRLSMVGEDAPKGVAARWPEFRTSLGTSKVIYKSQSGCVDLEFPKYGERVGELFAKIKGRMDASMQIEKTGKSASVRIENDRWEIDFSKPFEEREEVISEVLQAVSRLCELATTLNYSDLY